MRFTKTHNAQVLAMAAALAIPADHVPCFTTGVTDGFEQGFDLGTGMSYTEEEDWEERQWAYDLGTYVGACLALRP